MTKISAETKKELSKQKMFKTHREDLKPPDGENYAGFCITVDFQMNPDDKKEDFTEDVLFQK